MNTMRTITAPATVLLLACASAANAQQLLGGKLTVGVNVGAQTRSSTASTNFSFPVYGQTAGVTTSASVDGGPLFDLNGTYRFMPNIGVGVGYTRFSDTGVAQGAASIPSPLFFN